MVNFLAELSVRFDHEIHLTPSNSIARQSGDGIYELDIKSQKESSSYWLNWGGTFDNFQGTQIELYLGQFLTKVYSLEELLITRNSLYLRDDLIVMVNIPKHPWLYPDQSIEAQSIDYFLHSALNPEKPSNNRVRGSDAQTRLALPSLSVKLSDSVNGVSLNQGFSVALHNNDGYFDDEAHWNVHNTPLRLKKTVVDNPKYDDFKDIRVGLIENTVTDFDKFQIDVADRFRSMDNSVCAIITQERYPEIEIDEKALNKNIPIVYGRKKVKLQRLNDSTYLAAEKVTDVHGVYDRDGNELPVLVDNATSLIKVLSGGEADAAIITGYTDNKIADIIIALVARAGIPYGDSGWNKEEMARYLETSYRVNFVIESGNVRGAIQAVLKNDMAFFIQQNDGRFTIRKYGAEYATHTIPAWAVTKRPEKTWGAAQENYFSSCIINHDYTNTAGVLERRSLLYSEQEVEAEDTYRRLVRKTFETDLTRPQDAADLAVTLSDRYTVMMQTVKLAVGIDTSSFELLDRILFSAGINGRSFSRGEYFFIKEIDPAQDTITIEELFMWDFTGEYPDTTEYEYDIDNMYAHTQDEEFEYDINGGRL